MSYIFYVFLTTFIVFLTVIFCIAFIRHWFLERDRDFWERHASLELEGTEGSTDNLAFFNNRLSTGNLEVLGQLEKHRPSLSTSTSAWFRGESSSRKTSKDSGKGGGGGGGGGGNYDQEESSTSISSNQDTTTFPLLIGGNKSTQEDFLHQFLNKTDDYWQIAPKHSFKYNVTLPKNPSLPLPPLKRRSLPEILLYLAQKVQHPSKGRADHGHEIIINVEDFDKMQKLKHSTSLCVGLKGSLDLPVFDESPTGVEVKPIMRSGSSFDNFRLQFNSKKEETLI